MSPGPSVTLEMISDWTSRIGGGGFVETIRTKKWRKKKKETTGREQLPRRRTQEVMTQLMRVNMSLREAANQLLPPAADRVTVW